MKYEELKINFEKRNIEFEFYYTREELLKSVESELRNYSSIGIGNSQTLKTLKISEKASQMGKVVFDKTLAKNNNEIRTMKKKSINIRMLYI